MATLQSYDLDLESGPRQRKTLVHVLDLLGCVAVGPTTEDAIMATPEQRSSPRQLPSRPRTFRQARRRLLELDWEFLADLSRRPGGPPL